MLNKSMVSDVRLFVTFEKEDKEVSKGHNQGF